MRKYTVEQYREAKRLYRQKGMTYKKVAEQMGINFYAAEHMIRSRRIK